MTNARTSTTTHPDSLHALTTTRIPAKDQKNPDPTMPRQFAPRAEEFTNTLTRREYEERASLHQPNDATALSAAEDETTLDDAAASTAAEDKKPNDTATLRAVED
ncbi:hypothetical protein B0F90DRAFT_1820889 [Multifurca ochricompacta]|uniref:Uncharacterized protein n=1 Tax=Multifurca ochricompacta TaxID=376703 RepID=A0AAD4LYV1_9AGAM|nr:hypothetical protein B0F90DRAFT_1820889 [Multifurca ochricompacta]